MIGDFVWNNKFKEKSKKYNLYDIILKLKKQLSKVNNIQHIFFLSSLIAYIQLRKNMEYHINIDNMIFLKPNYFLLSKDEILDENNILIE